MGDVIDPKPSQWRRREPDTEQPGDRVISLAVKINELFSSEVDNAVTQIASLKLVQKALLEIVIHAYGVESAKEVLRQADEMVKQYVIKRKG